MPIRVLQVFGTLNRGGSETFIMNVYRNIDREKIQFDFLIHTPNKCDYEDEILSLGGRIYRSPKFKIYNYSKYCDLFNNFLQEHKEFKIIHGHNFNSASVYLGVAKKNNLISICHSHSAKCAFGIKGVIRKINKFRLKNNIDYKFACSIDAGNYLYGNNSKFVVVNNGIDSSKFIYNEEIRKKLRKDLNIPNDSIVLGHVGRFEEVKNHSFLIDVFKEFNKINSNSYLLLVGVGSLFDSIKTKVEKLGLEDKVLFLGSCGNVNEILQSIDLFIFPSIYEGLGISIIEAQAAGLKCIISNTITNEVILNNDLVKQLPINQGTNIWIEEINNSLIYNRENTSDLIVSKGYDIKYTVNYLTEFYLNL